jgi:hypothetical protein
MFNAEKEKQMSDEKRTRPENDLPRPERAKVEELRDWETLQQNENDLTQRLKIVGGWLYRTVVGGAVALVFVPGE